MQETEHARRSGCVYVGTSSLLALGLYDGLIVHLDSNTA